MAEGGGGFEVGDMSRTLSHGAVAGAIARSAIESRVWIRRGPTDAHASPQLCALEQRRPATIKLGPHREAGTSELGPVLPLTTVLKSGSRLVQESRIEQSTGPTVSSEARRP